MNYYPFHIGDFRSGTVNMSRQTRWIYRDMLDVYYDSEKPLSLDLDVLCDEIGAESDDERRIVEKLLRFKFVKSEDGYVHETCDRVIAEYRQKAETAKANGKLGGRPRKGTATEDKPSWLSVGYDPVSSGMQEVTVLEANQEPVTKNQEPIKRTAQPKRDPAGFAAFWAAYPKKAAKPDAERAFNKIDAALLPTILKAIEAFKKTEGWLESNGKFIPMPATWLNAKRWEDELTIAANFRPIIPFVKMPELPKGHKPAGLDLKSLVKIREQA